MNTRNFLALFIGLATAILGVAQTATLKADRIWLTASAGTVSLTAAATYDGQPSALAWSVALPEHWSFVDMAGPDVPAVAPAAGATGVLEFAFTTAPANRAEFVIRVRHESNDEPNAIVSSVILRKDGKLTNIAVAPVQFQGGRRAPTP